MKLQYMASSVAADHALPSAAVAASPPRGEPACWVARDAAFKRQQGIMLLGHAKGGGIAGKGSGGGCYDDDDDDEEEEELVGWTHGGFWLWRT